jgi:hypothetical protein
MIRRLLRDMALLSIVGAGSFCCAQETAGRDVKNTCPFFLRVTQNRTVINQLSPYWGIFELVNASSTKYVITASSSFDITITLWHDGDAPRLFRPEASIVLQDASVTLLPGESYAFPILTMPRPKNGVYVPGVYTFQVAASVECAAGGTKEKHEVKAVGAFEVIKSTSDAEDALVKEIAAGGARKPSSMFSNNPSDYAGKAWDLHSAIVDYFVMAEANRLMDKRVETGIRTLIQASKGTDSEDEALYLQMRLYAAQNRNADAQRTHKEIVERFPGSEAAALCRSKLIVIGVAAQGTVPGPEAPKKVGDEVMEGEKRRN